MPKDAEGENGPMFCEFGRNGAEEAPGENVAVGENILLGGMTGEPTDGEEL